VSSERKDEGGLKGRGKKQASGEHFVCSPVFSETRFTGT